MALTQEEIKIKESKERLEQRIKDFDKLIEEQTLNREKSQAELEKVAKKDVEKREEIKNNLSNIESELKSLNVKKTAVQIVGGLQTSLNNAVKLAGTSLVKTSEEVRTETLERIKQLATTDKGQQKAFELIRESLNEGIILSIDDFSDALGKEGKNFIKTFKTFDKNAKNLDRQQTELARKGLAFEVDYVNNRLRPIAEKYVKDFQRDFVILAKESDKNDRELKQLAKKKADDLTNFEISRIDELTRRQDEIIDLQQAIKDKGVKVRNNFEKSIFIPEELTNAFNDFFENQRAFLGNKSIKEKQEELGEFFDAITPAPIQDLFRGLTTAVSPVISTFKELLKPFKLIPFSIMKGIDFVKALFGSTDAIKETRIEQEKANKQNKKIRKETQKEDKKILEEKKKETKEGKERFPLLKKIGNTFKNIGRFIFALPGILLSLVVLGGVVLLFRKTLLALGRKFGLFKTEGEKADQKNLNEAKKDFEDMLKDRGVKLDRQFKDRVMDQNQLRAIREKARQTGTLDTPEFKRLEASILKGKQTATLGSMKKEEEKEREDFEDLELSILKDQSQIAKLKKQIEEGIFVKKSGKTKARFIKLDDKEKEKKRQEILKIEQSIEEQSKRLSKEFADVEAAEEKIVKQGELINNTQTTINNNTQSTIGFMKDNKDGSFMQNLIFKGFF